MALCFLLGCCGSLEGQCQSDRTQALRLRHLFPHLPVDPVLGPFLLKSGVHATLAGGTLALTVPLRLRGGKPDEGPL